MNHVDREEVIKFARYAIDKRLSAGLMIDLEIIARQYGRQEELVYEVEHWLQTLKKTHIEKWSESKRSEWFENDWLPSLPYPLKP